MTVDNRYERAGVSSEIVTMVMRRLSSLRAPVETIASPNVAVPCSPHLEDIYMVNEEMIVQRIRNIMKRP